MGCGLEEFLQEFLRGCSLKEFLKGFVPEDIPLGTASLRISLRGAPLRNSLREQSLKEFLKGFLQRSVLKRLLTRHLMNSFRETLKRNP